MKKLTPETTWESSWTMAVAAVRYCLGRRTYIVQRWPLFDGEDATDASESESRAQ